jgi:hypothetical protein
MLPSMVEMLQSSSDGGASNGRRSAGGGLTGVNRGRGATKKQWWCYQGVDVVDDAAGEGGGGAGDGDGADGTGGRGTGG